MNIEVLRADDIERLRPEWEALWRRIPEAAPFQAPAWLLPWWRQFGSGDGVIVTARRGDELIGILPLYRYRDDGLRKLLPLGISVSDYLDALVDPARPETAAGLLAATADIADWDECHIPDLPPDAALLRCTCPAGLQAVRAQTTPCPVLGLPESPAALPDTAPRKTLRDVRQARSRADAVGAVAIEQADAARLDAALEDYFRLHEKRWHSRGESGVCADPAVRAFQTEAARELLREGVLRLYTLRVGGEALAVYFGFLRGRRAYAYLGGFDPDWPRLSPGAQIIFHAIERAIAEGAREFHFLRGGEAYKYAWGAADRPNTALTLTRA